MTDSPNPRPRLKETFIAQIRDVDWTRSMARIVLVTMLVVVALLIAFMWAAVMIHGPDRGWLLSVAAVELVPFVDVPLEGAAP